MTKGTNDDFKGTARYTGDGTELTEGTVLSEETGPTDGMDLDRKESKCCKIETKPKQKQTKT